MGILKLVARRIVILVPVLALVSFGVFALMLALPGEPAETLAGGANATPASIAKVRTQLGLDDSYLTQYARWVGNAVHFDFGKSLQTGRSISTDLKQRMPITLSLALVGLGVAIVLGLVAGALAGSRPGGAVDKLTIVGATLGVAVPSLVVAIALVKLLAINVHWLPAVGFVRLTNSPSGWAKSLVLPCVALGLAGAGSLARQLRSGLVDNIGSDYVRTSWSVGSPASIAVGRHAMRNAAVPAVTVAGLQLTALLGGTVIIEQVFSIQGIGTYLYAAVLNKDLPVIQAVIVWFALVQLGVFLLVDIALGLLNPRIRVK